MIEKMGAKATLKVGLVHSFYTRSVPSGENAVVADQERQLVLAGVEVRRLYRETDEMSQGLGYSMRAASHVATGFGRSPLAEMDSRSDLDVVHVHNLFPNWGWRWLRQSVVPVVATVHNFRPVCANGILWRDGADCKLCPTRSSINAIIHSCYKDSRLQTAPLAWASRASGRRNALLKRADAVIALNDRAAETYAPIVGSEKIHVIPNFIRESSQMISKERDGFVYVGRLTQEKGILQLMDAWPTEQSLTVVGDGPLRNAVEGRAAIGSNIKYVGAATPDDVTRVLSRSEALVVPSRWREGIPTVIGEALSVGTPVFLSTSVDAYPMLSVSGAVVGIDTSDLRHSLQGAIRLLATMSPEIHTVAESAYQTFFSPAGWTTRMLSLYRSVC